jgi:hypothetical protein
MTIRYRVWDGQKMDDWDGFFLNTEGGVLYSGHGGLEPLPDHIPLLSTGLRDCNGKEIFEGDIIYGGGEGSEYLVLFKECSFWAKHIRHPDVKARLGKYVERHRVIGNIYENPELIK